MFTRRKTEKRHYRDSKEEEEALKAVSEERETIVDCSKKDSTKESTFSM